MKKKLHMAAMLLAFCTLAACNDDETDMGSTLMDANIIYNGKSYTMTVDTAYSMRDDSLLTTGNNEIIIGDYNDATFGRVTAQYFTQITLPNAAASINFDAVTIDSVVMTLVYDSIYPDATQSHSLHFEVRQLANAISTDSSYYAFHSIEVESGTPLYDGTVSVAAGNGTVRLVLGGNINDILRLSGDRESFATLTKGLRIAVNVSGSDNVLVPLNLSDTRTIIRAHYRYGDDTAHYDFSISNGKHFTHFEHDYAGTVMYGQATIDGANRLYLEPLAGYNVVVSFDNAIRTFREAHPLAVIHSAELIVPVATEASGTMPKRIIATNGKRYITDYISASVDGYYDIANRRYRIRMPLHVQEMLRDGYDNGIHLLIDGRGSAAERTLLNGCNRTDKIRIELIYTE